MGKKQHQSDKLYITASEWRDYFGGKKKGDGVSSSDRADFRRLPFDHCALSLQPFDAPYCDEDGNIFDLVHIVPYMKKFKTNPVTGKPLEPKLLTKLNFHKNSKGELHCPVMFKVFNNNVHMVAVRTTGNVFSHEAVDELNLKTKNFKDLLTSEPFARSDLVVLQDPMNYSKFNLNTFHHIKNNMKVHDEDLERARIDPAARIKRMNNVTKEVLTELEKTHRKTTDERPGKEEEKKADRFNAAPYSTGKVAASFTSTAMARETVHEAAVLEEDVVRYARVKKKAYVRLVTNLGNLNAELHSDQVPKTCENFVRLCQQGYYDGTKFHRSIRHFMVQGGDPTATGNGGESAWKTPFKDEFKPNLNHAGRGVLSMANSGPNTNKSQFFITYRSCKHLDGKHTVFGRVVGGADTTLSAIEKVGTDNKDRPVEDIVLQRAQVFVDPFEEADEQLAGERAEELEKAREKEEAVKAKRRPDGERKVYTSGVGKFISPSLKREARKADGGPSKKAKSTRSALSDFSGW